MLLLAMLWACTEATDPKTPTEPLPDRDGDGYGDSDCDDSSAAVHPGADERCDGLDNDCDGEVDEDAVDGNTWYADADADGFGADAIQGCEAPAGAVTNGYDCDDEDPSAHPDAEERCNLADDDCDGLIDEDAAEARAWYADTDGDNLGAGEPTSACEAPAGSVADGSDCDDTDPDTWPGAPEACTDLADRDCDGLPGGQDNDTDTYAACEDCDDSNFGIHPDATETCDEANVDEDCSGAADDDDPGVDPAGQITGYTDADADGFGDSTTLFQSCDLPPGATHDATDCDDTNPLVSPSAPELCGGGDEDCDGWVDDLDPDVTGTSTWYEDHDGDGVGSASGPTTACTRPADSSGTAGDCDDNDDARYPGATELCDSGDVDEDCDGLAEDDDPESAGGTQLYADADGDGWGADTSTTTACDLAPGLVTVPGDCDEGDPEVFPAATEVCDAVDNDCDGLADEDDADLSGGIVLYRDVDEDGWGGASSLVACAERSGWTTSGGDCDDLDALVSPDASERCDGVLDEDCDGLIDDDDVGASGTTTWYQDGDGDGYGGSTTIDACSAPPGALASGGDCHDGDPAVSPAATETCDGVDQDCDGAADQGLALWYPDYDGDGFGDLLDPGSCSPGHDLISDNTDCDESDAAVNPDALEACTTGDEDCDGLDADGDPDVIGTTFYADADADGYGDDSLPRTGCTLAAGEALVGGDCDEADAAVHPGATEIYGDTFDDNCDGEIDPEVSACVGYDVPGDYSTLSAAVAAQVSPICLGAGTFRGDIECDYDCTIQGEGPETSTILGNVTHSLSTDVLTLSHLGIEGYLSTGNGTFENLRVDCSGENSAVNIGDVRSVSPSFNRLDATCPGGRAVEITASNYRGTPTISISNSWLHDSNQGIHGGIYTYPSGTSGNISFWVYNTTIDGNDSGIDLSVTDRYPYSAIFYEFNNLYYNNETALSLDLYGSGRHYTGPDVFWANNDDYAASASASVDHIRADPELDTSYAPPRFAADSIAAYAGTTYYTAIPADFYGVTRDASAPSIGAVEP